MTADLKVPTIARRFVSFIKARPVFSLYLSCMLVLALFPGLGGMQANFTYRGFFHADDPLILDFDKFERQFGNDSSVVLAVHSPSGIFDVETTELLKTLTEEMWTVPEVIRVDSLTNYNWVHADGDELIVEPFIPDDIPLSAKLLKARKKTALKHEILPRYLVSEDAKTSMIFAAIKPGLERPPNSTAIVGAVRELKKKYQTGDHQLYISGGPAVTLGFKEASQEDLILNAAVLGVTTILLGLLLRSFWGITLSLAVVFMSVICGFAIGGWLSVEITNITVILPQIMVAIGVADSVHILVGFFQAMSQGYTRQQAAEYSLLKNFMPTLITSITTAVGFLTFLSADLKPIVGLGIMAGSGTLVAWIFTYLVLGALLFLLPIKRQVLPPERTAASIAHARWMTDLLARYRTPVLAGFGALCVFSLFFALKNTVNSDPFKYFREGFPLRVANDFIEEHVGGARGVELSIDTGREEGIKDPAFLKKVEKFQAWIDELPHVTRTISIVDILKMTNRSLNGDAPKAYILPSKRNTVAQELFLYQMSLPQGMNINDRITIKNDSLRLTVLWTIKTSNEVTQQIAEIEAKGQEMGLAVSATGKNRIWLSMNAYVVNAFILSLTLALFLISVILSIFFRSLSIGLLAMVPNAVPLVIGGGVLYALNKPLDIGVALVTAVCLGIAVDDTIHVLSNYIRLTQEGKTDREAVIDILGTTGPALVTTSAILVLAFGTLAFGTFVPTIYFGLMTAIILSVALVTDLTFLPAMLLIRQSSATYVEPEESIESSLPAELHISSIRSI